MSGIARVNSGGLIVLMSRLGKVLLSNRVLAWEMAKRDLILSNKGAMLGFAWIIIRPFVQVGAMVVVVTFIFGARLDQTGSRFAYAIYVLAGMIPWQIMTKSLEEAPSLVRDRVEMLKQVLYPLEILPITSILLALVGPSIALLIYVVLAGFSNELHWTIILLPIPAFLLACFLVGSAWILMIIGVLLKDLREIIGVILGLLVFMSPVVLSESIVGPQLWSVLQLNPLFHVIISFRDVFNATFHPRSWLIFATMSVFCLVCGALVLARAKTIFNEYI